MKINFEQKQKILEKIDGTYLTPNYELDEWIATGGFGVVYKAKYYLGKKYQKDVAIKLIPFDDQTGGNEQLIAEADYSKNLKHPNLIRCESIGDFAVEYRDKKGNVFRVEGIYIHMELAPEEYNLKKYLREKGGKLDDKTVLNIATQLFELLEYFSDHSPIIVHQDIKLENIFGFNEKNSIIWKLSDLGLIKEIEKTDTKLLVSSSKNLGTIEYVPPESVSGGELVEEAGTKKYKYEITPAWDIWSMGVLIYELLKGSPPFGSRNAGFRIETILNLILTLEPDYQTLPAPFYKIVKRCLDKDRKKRGTAKEMLQILKGGESPVTEKKWTEPITGMVFVWVPGGKFMMGSNEYNNEKPIHEVKLDGFWIGKYPVTQKEWKIVMNDNPSGFKKGDNYPVENVSWDDTQIYIEKLKGLNKVNYKFSLPTEAQWEYACRAGTITPFYFGETISTDQANYDGNNVYGKGKKGIYRESTTPVGSFQPNAFGLYDMHGNIWEWCKDIYADDAYTKHIYANPENDAGGSNRVLRGGSWNDNPVYLRSADRNSYHPAFRFSAVGFRLLRTL